LLRGECGTKIVTGVAHHGLFQASGLREVEDSAD